MPLSLEDFWNLVAGSQLLSQEECAALAAEFAALKGVAGQANVPSLAQWLVARGTLTKYQAGVLAAGRPGPFIFGPFVVYERIETGRLAKLYRATYEGSQPVLLVFLQRLTDDARDHQQFAELAQVAAAVKNPHVSRTYGATRQGGQAFVVSESLSGQTLEELPRAKYAPQAACQLAFQLALGLVALHAEKLTHGGICPRNIWIDAHGAAKLMQFPLVQPASRQPRFDLPLLDYLAPEWTSRQAQATPLVDVYGLGCVLYELIAGRVPFPGGTAQQKIARHRGQFPQRLDEIDPNVPEDLADLVGEMLAKDPVLRCQTANEVSHLLAPFATATRGRVTPPKLDPQALTPGYGAWTAPAWQAPPQQAPPRQTAPQPPAPQPVPRASQPLTQTERAVENQAASAAKPTHAKLVAPAESPKRDRTPPPARPAPSAKTEAVVAPAIVVDVTQRSSVPPARETDDSTLAFVVNADPAGSKHRTIHPRSSPALYASIGGALLLTVAALFSAWMLYGGASNATPAVSSPVPSTPDAPASNSSESGSPLPTSTDNTGELAPPLVTPEDSNLIDDDGETLWASPTSGKPLNMTYLPGGAQLIFVLRPAELLSSPEGSKLLAALGPAGTSAVTRLRETLGVDLTRIEQLTIGFVPDESLLPQANYVLRLAEEVSRDKLLDQWGQPTKRTHAQKDFYERNGRAYYLPESGAGQVVVIGPVAMLKQVLELDGQPLLRSGIEDLLRHSDDQRHITFVFAPSYLLTDGRSLLAGNLSQLHAPIREFLDESIEAVLLSAHVGDELFVEFRAVAPVDRKPAELKELLRTRWAAIPERVESHVAALHPQPHGQLVIHRFPRMLQLARDYTRSGVDEGQAVLSAYLPTGAAHNMLLGADLTLLESGGETNPGGAPAVSTPRPQAAADALARKISLSFPREALEPAVQLLAKELSVPIAIVGADLQLEGITKNQSLNNVDQRDQPAGDVLRKLLKLANPDGKLVYQIKPDSAGRETIFITTRAAVLKRGEPLPPGF